LGRDLSDAGVSMKLERKPTPFRKKGLLGGEFTFAHAA
jgi:hypothetical protein